MYLITFPGVYKWICDWTCHTAYADDCELFAKLFEKYVHDENIAFGKVRVSQFKTGAENLPEQMVDLYTKNNEYIAQLVKTMEKVVYANLINAEKALQVLYVAAEWDDGLPERWHNDILESYTTDGKENICKWLAKVMRYAITPRENPRVKKSLQNVGIGYIPRPCGWFRGRENELGGKKKPGIIEELLKAEKNVFLQGIAGIGKSELAKKYVDTMGKKYSAVLWISCRGSLWQSIAEMHTLLDKPEDDLQTRFRRHMERLQWLPEKGLLILDNCGCLPEDAAVLDKILRCRCYVLITTRTYLEDRVNLKVEELKEDQLLDIFKYFRKGSEAPERDMRKLIRLLHGHTFAVELAARLTRKNTPTPGVLCGMLKTERFLRGVLKKCATHQKDNSTQKDSYYDAMHNLFALFMLDKGQQSLMSNMSLMPEQGVYRDNLLMLLNLPDDGLVEALEELGLLRWDGDNEVVQMLPMIREITLADLRPTIHNCGTLVNTIAEQCANYDANYRHYALLFKIVDQMIAEMDKREDLPRYWDFLCNVFNYMDGLDWKTAMYRVFGEIEEIANTERVSNHGLAEYLDMKACLENDPHRKVELEERALAILEEAGAGDCQLAKNIRNNLGGAQRMVRNYDVAIPLLENRLKELITQKDAPEKLDYITCVTNLAVSYAEVERFDTALALLEPMVREMQEKEPDSKEYGKVLETMATVRLEQRQLPAAKSLYREAMLIWEKRYKDTPELIQQKATEYREYCCRYLLSPKATEQDRLAHGIIQIPDVGEG